MRSILLNWDNGFEGLKSFLARNPTVTDQEWKDACDIARDFANRANPIGTCLWFNKPDIFDENTYSYGGYVYYRFPESSSRIVEQTQIGEHIFFNVAGY